jgi:hypothetical protein
MPNGGLILMPFGLNGFCQSMKKSWCRARISRSGKVHIPAWVLDSPKPKVF